MGWLLMGGVVIALVILSRRSKKKKAEKAAIAVAPAPGAPDLTEPILKGGIDVAPADPLSGLGSLG